jgi:uncharacterized peroxidase-related enzyme
VTRLTTEFTPTAEATKMLDGVKQAIGKVPNMYKLMSQATNVFEAYLNNTSLLSKGTLSAADREQIALVVAGYDRCTYCASAHTLLAQKQGVKSEEAKMNLKAQSTSPRTTALLKFCIAILQSKAKVSDDDLKALRTEGFNDVQIIEIVALVSASIFTNYFNNLADPEIDFPVVSLD